MAGKLTKETDLEGDVRRVIEIFLCIFLGSGENHGKPQLIQAYSIITTSACYWVRRVWSNDSILILNDLWNMLQMIKKYIF
jgi:hypothetical protein